MIGAQLFLKKSENIICRFPLLLSVISCFVLTLVTHGDGYVYLPFLLAVVTLLVALFLIIEDKLNEKRIVILIFVLGFLLRFLYVLYTEVNIRQHDVEIFGNGIGHSGYIEYILDNFSLPQSEVKSVWQFYHPPLHHIISAIYIKIQQFFGADYSEAIEGLGMLSLFYTTATLINGYRIYEEISEKGKVTAALLLSFCPSFVIFSGSINNDPLSFFLMITALLYTVRWYKTRKIKHLIFSGLSVGFGMFTKVSAVFVAVPMAIIFLYVLIFDRRSKKIGKLIGEYVLFGAVSIPIGVYWSVRNLVRYGVPLTYVPMLSFDNPQYVGYHSVFDRLFNFTTDSVFDAFGRTYYEFNPTLGLIKTALFGESLNDCDYPEISFVGVLLFVFGTLMTILIVASAIWVLLNSKKDKNNCIITVSLFVFCLLNFALYYKFCFSYPFTCTQNIRYCATAEIIGLLFVSKLSGETKKKWLKYIVNTIAVITSLLTAMTYILIL